MNGIEPDNDWVMVNHVFNKTNSSNFFKKNLGDLTDEKIQSLFQNDVARLVSDRQTLSISGIAIQPKDALSAIKEINRLSGSPDLANRVMEAASQRSWIVLRSFVAPDNSIFSSDSSCTHTAIRKSSADNINVTVYISGNVKGLMEDLDVVADWSKNPRSYEAEMSLQLSRKPNQDQIQITPLQNLKALV